jgi:large subunit ribosomal protein L5
MSGYTPRLKTEYTETIAPVLMDRFKYRTVMQVPRLKKIVLSQGLGDATADKKIIDNALSEMTIISGQKAIATYAKKDVSNFKLRKGMPIGAKVTLRVI